MRTKSIKYMKGYYGTTGSIREYSDGTARLRIRQMGKLLHNKVHKNTKAAMAAWYRYNN